MKNRIGYMACGCTCLALLYGAVQWHSQGTTGTVAAAEPASAAHKADEAALRKLSAQFAAAIGRGDPQALARFWTAEGEYVGGNGVAIRGREAIEKAYAQRLKERSGAKVEAHIEAIHFVAQDNAVEEGTAHVERAPSLSTTNRFSILFTRENGTWRIAILREWPEDGASLHDLDWLVGTWSAKTPRGEVRTTYRWADNKKFLHMQFEVKGPDGTTSGSQTIAADPRTDGLRSWLFQKEGGFSEAAWSWDGKRWVMKTSGVEADSTEVTATNIMTPLNHNTFLWQSVERTLGGEEQPDVGPIRVTRVEAANAGQR